MIKNMLQGTLIGLYSPKIESVAPVPAAVPQSEASRIAFPKSDGNVEAHAYICNYASDSIQCGDTATNAR